MNKLERAASRSTDVAFGMAILVAAIGVAVLAGWLFELEPLMTVLPGYIRMKSNTAIAFIAAAVALMFEHYGVTAWARRVSSTVTLAFGGATLIEYLFGISLHIDELFFHDPVQQVYPGRMAHVTAVNFVFLGAALLCRTATPRRVRTADVFACLVVLFSLFAVVGYAYGVPLLYGSIRYTAMAFHTGLSFLLLGLAAIFMQPHEGLASLFWSETTGGMVARRLIPTACLVPIFLGACFVHPELNFGEMRLGLALTAMSSVIFIVAVTGVLARSLTEAESARMQAERNSCVDELTRAYNRRYFDRRMVEEMTARMRSGRPLSLIVFDVDRFKRVNDEFGHVAGDAVLREVATIASTHLRASEVLCRYGGEEFAVIVADAPLHSAAVVAERLRSAIGKSVIEEIGRPVTISAGVAQWDADSDTVQTLVARADEALYEAKHNGRDRVQVRSEARRRELAETNREAAGGPARPAALVGLA